MPHRHPDSPPKRRDPAAIALARRPVLAGLAAAIVAMPVRLRGETAPPAPIHLLPNARGASTGQDWANAASFRQSGRYAAQSQPGQVFHFGLPSAGGPIEWSGQQIPWDAGGTEAAPLDLRFGALSVHDEFAQPTQPDAAPLVRMIGNETAPGERPDVGGAPYIVMRGRSSHLSVSGPVYDRSGAAGFFQLDAEGTLSNLRFADIHARNAGRVIETTDGTSVNGLLVQRCTALGLIRGFARFHEASNAHFEDLDLDADFRDGGGGAVCQIISIVRGHALSFSNIRLAKAVNSLAAEERGSPYIQGDGIVLEEDTHNVTIEGCHASDMGDGGFDLKSEGVVMRDCTATRCKLGIRIWSQHPDNLIERCTVTEPVTRPQNEGACLWVAGRLTARDCALHATGDMSPIRFGSGPNGQPQGNLTIRGGEISHDESTTLTTGSAGELELENVMVNGAEVSGRFRWTGRRLRRA